MHLLVLRLKRYGAVDACLFMGALVLFAVNEHLAKPAVLSVVSAGDSLAEGASAAGFSFFCVVKVTLISCMIGTFFL